MRSFFIFCASCCFIALLKMPITYYTFLRVVVSLGSILAIYIFLKQQNYSWAVVFALLLMLFNPVFPIYLYRKSVWMPLDVITGFLFLFLALYNKKDPLIEEKPKEVLSVQKTHSRDRIVPAKREAQ